jgi:hypothetical protein
MTLSSRTVALVVLSVLLTVSEAVAQADYRPGRFDCSSVLGRAHLRTSLRASSATSFSGRGANRS